MEALSTQSPDEKSGKPIAPGHFVPQCAADGSFKEVQCYGSTGYCWCVDGEGSPVLGTMMRGLPHCNKTALGGGIFMFHWHFLQYLRHPDLGVVDLLQ